MIKSNPIRGLTGDMIKRKVPIRGLTGDMIKRKVPIRGLTGDMIKRKIPINMFIIINIIVYNRSIKIN